jgi:hypothetical protein
VFCKVRLPAFDILKLVSQGRIEPAEWSFGGWLPQWWPQIAFSWWVFVGCSVCFLVSCLVPTPRKRVEYLEEHLVELKSGLVASGQE